MIQNLTKKEFEKFINKVRRMTFELPLRAKHLQEGTKFIRPKQKDIDKVIGFDEVKTIILEDFAISQEDDFVSIDDDTENCNQIFNAVFQRLINNELCLMASEGILECYFDDEEKDFVFKLKE